eukprot:Pgem_evm1s9358
MNSIIDNMEQQATTFGLEEKIKSRFLELGFPIFALRSHVGANDFSNPSENIIFSALLIKPNSEKVEQENIEKESQDNSIETTSLIQ